MVTTPRTSDQKDRELVLLGLMLGMSEEERGRVDVESCFENHHRRQAALEVQAGKPMQNGYLIPMYERLFGPLADQKMQTDIVSKMKTQGIRRRLRSLMSGVNRVAGLQGFEKQARDRMTRIKELLEQL